MKGFRMKGTAMVLLCISIAVSGLGTVRAEGMAGGNIQGTEYPRGNNTVSGGDAAGGGSDAIGTDSSTARTGVGNAEGSTAGTGAGETDGSGAGTGTGDAGGSTAEDEGDTEQEDAGTGELVFETDLIPSGQHIDWVPGETLGPGEYTLDFLQIPYYPDPSGGYISLTQGSNQVTLAILD